MKLQSLLPELIQNFLFQHYTLYFKGMCGMCIKCIRALLNRNVRCVLIVATLGSLQELNPSAVLGCLRLLQLSLAFNPSKQFCILLSLCISVAEVPFKKLFFIKSKWRTDKSVTSGVDITVRE